MPLSAGDRLGPYEILAPIGAGGMGEVYRAKDTRLHRDVAVKVSKEQFSERFEREARAVAALNHPNICTLHDVGPNYLVMELVDGQTLAERIQEGPIYLEEALTLAKQIADALEAAHDKGIVHRDLKPGNVKITPEGKVKVLDFGLAKSGGTPGIHNDNSPTVSMGATEAGVILGTAAYMSPEQARGKPVDKRADIWSFGVVLYEMLTGKRLFHGESVSDVLAGVIKEEPNWDRVPAKARRLLKSCLEKDPKHRLHDIADAWKLLEDAPASTGGRPWLWIAAAAGFGLTSIVFGLLYWRSTGPVEPSSKPLVRLDLDLGPDAANASLNGASVILSPDGARLVYVSQGKLFTRRLDQFKATELAGTEGAFAPFFSPDGKWLAFFTSSQLKKISAEGGAAVVLCNASNPRGGTWSEEGTIVLALGNQTGLSRIPDSGGTPTPITELAKGETSHRRPQFLPGGKAVLFVVTATPAGGGSRLEVLSLLDRTRKIVLPRSGFGRYLSSGHLIFTRQSGLFAVPFDLDALEPRGTPVPVLEDVAYSSVYASAQVDVSPAGTVVYRTGIGVPQLTVQWMDSLGKTQPLLTKRGDYINPRVSPDGRRLALPASNAAGTDLWVYDWQRDSMMRLTTGTAGGSVLHSWSPDGRFIVFGSQGGVEILWTRSDAGSQPQVLLAGKTPLNPWSFTPDGKRLVYTELSPQTGTDIWTVPVESDGAGLHAGKPEPFLKTSFQEASPSFSPDGRWLAYSSNESGTPEIYVRAFPDKGGKWQVSQGGGRYPVWSRTARELLFRTDDNQVMAATYTVQGDSFVPDKPRIWSERRLADVGLNASFDLAPDGKRIAALLPATGPDAPQSHVVLLQNFFDELRRRVSAAK